MRSVCAGILAMLLLGALAGCARFPTTTLPTTTPAQTLYAEIDVVGSINSNDYYFFALNFDPNNVSGPVPVLTGPEYSNGWGTLSGLPGGQVQIPPFYVQYYNNTFVEYYGNGQLIGQPFNSGVSGNKLWVEINTKDFSSLIPTNNSQQLIQANWITMDYVDPPNGQMKQYDAMVASNTASTANGWLNFPLNQAQVYTSGVNGIPVQPTYGSGQESAANPDLDIEKWDIEIRNNTSSSGTTTP